MTTVMPGPAWRTRDAAGWQTQLQRIEIQAVWSGDDDLAVKDARRRQSLDQRVVQLGEVAVQRPKIPALNVHVVCGSKDDGPEAIPFWFVEKSVAFREWRRQFGEHRLNRRE
jgi:hypothetical protein